MACGVFKCDHDPSNAIGDENIRMCAACLALAEREAMVSSTIFTTYLRKTGRGYAIVTWDGSSLGYLTSWHRGDERWSKDTKDQRYTLYVRAKDVRGDKWFGQARPSWDGESAVIVRLRRAKGSVPLKPVPLEFPVTPLWMPQEVEALVMKGAKVLQCSTCKRWWDDSAYIERTPIPSDRCPFTEFH